MKDEINGPDHGGSGRRLARGNWAAMQGVRRRAAPPRREALATLRVCGATVPSGGPFGLLHVYTVLSLWPACDRSPLEQHAYDIALNRMIERIMKEGATAPSFATKVEVFAYAKRVRATALIDAHRHMEVVERNRRSTMRGSGVRMNGAAVGPPPGVVHETADWDDGRAEQCEWLVSQLGSEAAALVERVHLDDETIAEIARESGEPESTVRSRYARAMTKARACLEAEAGYVGLYSNN